MQPNTDSQEHPYRPSALTAAPLPTSPGLRPARLVEILVAVALAVVADVAFCSDGRWVAGGNGLALLLGLAPLLLLIAARRVRRSPRLLVVTALLGLITLRGAWLPTPSVVVSGVALLLAFTVTLRGRGVYLPEMARSLLRAFDIPPRVGALVVGVGQLARRSRIAPPRLAPILVPLSLVVLFSAVFGLANPLVAHGLERVFGLLGRFFVLPSAPRVLLSAAGIVGAAMLLRPSLVLSRCRSTERAAETGESSSMSREVARNALVALNALFLGYNALDAAYLWAGAPPSGMTTQDYAHAGAAWLSVAMVALTLVVGVMFRGALAHDPRARLPRTLAFVWLAQGGILALGTWRRIAIHVAWSGLSNFRIVGILGTTLVVVGLVLVGLKLHRRRTFLWLLRRQLDAFALTFVLFTLLPTHLVSARVNVGRILGGEQRPLLHMIRQSTEAESATSLLPLLTHGDPRVRQGVASLLLAERDRLRAELGGRFAWQQLDLRTAGALAILDSESPRLDAILEGTDRDRASAALWALIVAANTPE